MSSKIYCCICKKAIYSNYKGKFPTCPAHKGMRPNDNKPPMNKPTTQAIRLSIPSVIKFFQSMVVNNCGPKEFDACVEKLQKITISTFTPKKSQYAKNTVDMNVVKEYVTMFNKYSTNKDDTIEIALGTYDANQWLNLYIECLPKNGLPEYSNEWYSALQWLVHNIIRSIYGVKRTENIAMTKTFDRKNVAKMTHEEYANSVKCSESSLQNRINDLEWLISHPPANELHRKLLWGVLMLNFGLFDYGPLLNKYMKAINHKVKLPSQTYLQLLTELRKIGNPVETEYNRCTCIVIAQFIEGIWLLHYGGYTTYEYMREYAYMCHILSIRKLFELSIPSKIPGVRRRGLQFIDSFYETKERGMVHTMSNLGWLPLVLTYDEETLMDHFEFVVSCSLGCPCPNTCTVTNENTADFIIASAKSLQVEEFLCNQIMTLIDTEEDNNDREHAIRIAAYSLMHGLINIDSLTGLPPLFIIDVFKGMLNYVGCIEGVDKKDPMNTSAPLVIRYYIRREIFLTIITHYSDLIRTIHNDLCKQTLNSGSLMRYKYLAMDFLELVQ